MSRWRCRPPVRRVLGRDLLVGGEFVVADHLPGEPSLINPPLPFGLELRRHDDQRHLALAERVFLEEREADLSLAGADAVGVDDAVVPLDDLEGPPVAVPLKCRQVHLAGADRLLGLRVVAEKLQQRPQEHQPGIGEVERGRAA